MKREELQNAFAPIPDDCYDALMTAAHSVKEEPVMKRKLSVAFVFAIAMVILLVGVAFAIVHFSDYATEIAMMELDKGRYETWNAEDRIRLVRILTESGVLEEDERVKSLLSGTLPDEEASALATEIIIDWGPVREDMIGLVSILETVWGPEHLWPLEDKVWYSQIQVETGTLSVNDPIINVMPGSDDVPEDQAIAAAAKALEAAYGLETGVLEKAQVGVEFYKELDSADRPNWLVMFRLTNAEGKEGWYDAVVSGETGEVIADPLLGMRLPEEIAEERAAWEAELAAWEANPLSGILREFDEENGSSLYSASLEAKAYFSEHLRPLILEAYEAEPDNQYLPMIETTYIYGLPSPEHITEAEAEAIAREAVLQEVPIRKEVLDVYMPYTYFDVTDPDKPLWKFYFNAYSGIYEINDTLSEDEWDRGYKVELDARDGTITKLWVDKDVIIPDAPYDFLRFL